MTSPAKILSRESTYILNVFMWSRFGNCSTSMREVIIISIYKDLHTKTPFFEGYFWFKFNKDWR